MPLQAAGTASNIRATCAQILSVVYGQQLPSPDASIGYQVFGVAVATTGLATFALVLALLQQVVLEVIDENVKQGRRVYEEKHVRKPSTCRKILREPLVLPRRLRHRWPSMEQGRHAAHWACNPAVKPCNVPHCPEASDAHAVIPQAVAFTLRRTACIPLHILERMVILMAGLALRQCECHCRSWSWLGQRTGRTWRSSGSCSVRC